MADTYKTTNTLGIGIAWTDGDDKERISYIKLPNPNEGVTQADITNAAKTLFSGNDPILRDINGGTIDADNAIVTAYTEEQEIIELDIE